MIPPEATQHYNRASKYLESGNYERALVYFKKSLLATRGFKELYLNMGNCYRLLGNDKKAIECYQISNKASTPFHNSHYSDVYPLALNNLGLMHYMQGQDKLALQCYEQALAVDPEYYDCLWNKATAILRQASSGHPELFEQGWQLYEYRFLKTPPVQLKNSKPGLTPWDGVSKIDSVIVMAEQGIGDNFMWARYIPQLQALVPEVWVQCNTDMAPLFEQLGVKTLLHTTECAATYAVTMGSLSKQFNNLPRGDWLRDYGKPHNFEESSFNIGIVHAGSATHANNHNRSVSIHRFNKLAAFGRLYSLCPGFKSTRQVTALDPKSWAETVGYIRGLDLVITVDTSIVHLCGSLGVECWMLQPLKETDFRWGDESMGSLNSWYSSVKVFRNPNSWDVVFDNVLQDLKDRLYA